MPRTTEYVAIAVIGIDIGKELVPRRWPGQAWSHSPAPEMVTRPN